MQDKQKVTQKVTFYLPDSIHQQLKIRSAIDGDTMSELATKAISFYLSHPDIVESLGIGHTHQTYNCPTCCQAVVVRDGELLAIGGNRNSMIPVTVGKTDSHDEGLLSIS